MREISVETADGELAVAVSEGDDPEVLLAHATGFCKEIWSPVAGVMTQTTVAWDGRNHGRSFRAPRPLDWWDYGRDALEIVSARASPEAPVGVGHSMGGASLVLAELLSPATFAGLVLVEPIIFPPPYGRWENRMVAGAARRQNEFGSLGEARSYLRSKPVFASWTDASLDAYVAGGFEAGADGSVSLRCIPADEADVFAGSTAHGAWDRLGELDLPILVLAGTETATYPINLVEEMVARMPRGTLDVWQDADHFIPMRQPDELAARIGDFLADLG